LDWGYVEDPTLGLTTHIKFEQKKVNCYKICKILLSIETRQLSVFGRGPAKSIPE